MRSGRAAKSRRWEPTHVSMLTALALRPIGPHTIRFLDHLLGGPPNSAGSGH